MRAELGLLTMSCWSSRTGNGDLACKYSDGLRRMKIERSSYLNDVENPRSTVMASRRRTEDAEKLCKVKKMEAKDGESALRPNLSKRKAAGRGNVEAT